jgi:2-iminobutanoate/2-iminopropanoate deaminase
MPKDESPIERVVVEGLGRLPQFCHATIADGWIHVSGTLGTRPGSMDLVPGGTGPQTTQTLRNIETILGACGVGMADVVKMSVFLADMDTFPEMNEAYSAVMGSDPPARITVGRAGLALGAAVEIECVAYRPNAAANGSE